jgi:hypothetical protein
MAENTEAVKKRAAGSEQRARYGEGRIDGRRKAADSERGIRWYLSSAGTAGSE